MQNTVALMIVIPFTFTIMINYYCMLLHDLIHFYNFVMQISRDVYTIRMVCKLFRECNHRAIARGDKCAH